MYEMSCADILTYCVKRFVVSHRMELEKEIKDMVGLVLKKLVCKFCWLFDWCFYLVRKLYYCYVTQRLLFDWCFYPVRKLHYCYFHPKTTFWLLFLSGETVISPKDYFLFDPHNWIAWSWLLLLLCIYTQCLHVLQDSKRYLTHPTV